MRELKDAGELLHATSFLGRNTRKKTVKPTSAQHHVTAGIALRTTQSTVNGWLTRE